MKYAHMFEVGECVETIERTVCGVSREYSPLNYYNKYSFWKIANAENNNKQSRNTYALYICFSRSFRCMWKFMWRIVDVMRCSHFKFEKKKKNTKRVIRTNIGKRALITTSISVWHRLSGMTGIICERESEQRMANCDQHLNRWQKLMTQIDFKFDAKTYVRRNWSHACENSSSFVFGHLNSSPKQLAKQKESQRKHIGAGHLVRDSLLSSSVWKAWAWAAAIFGIEPFASRPCGFVLNLLIWNERTHLQTASDRRG